MLGDCSNFAGFVARLATKNKKRSFLPELGFDRSVLGFAVKQLDTRLASPPCVPSGTSGWLIHRRDGDIIGLLWCPLHAGSRFPREPVLLLLAVRAFWAAGGPVCNVRTARGQRGAG